MKEMQRSAESDTWTNIEEGHTLVRVAVGYQTVLAEVIKAADGTVKLNIREAKVKSGHCGGFRRHENRG